LVIWKHGALVYHKKEDDFYYFESRFNGYTMALQKMDDPIGLDMDGNPIPNLIMAWTMDVRLATPEERSAFRLMRAR
jgi:hypothetical protein